MSEQQQQGGQQPERVVHQHLRQAIVGVMQDVEYIRRRKAAGLNYTILKEEDVIDAFRDAFLRHGLIILPRAAELSHQEHYQTSKGTANRVIVAISYTLIHVDSGEEKELAMLGEGADNGDKATAKALTFAFKYIFRQSTLLVTGDDPDRTPSREVERGGGQQQGDQGRQQPSNGQAQQGQQQQRQGQQQGGQGSPPSIFEQYQRALNAIYMAPTAEKLEKYMAAASRRQFSDDHRRGIQEAYAKSRDRLSSQSGGGPARDANSHEYAPAGQQADDPIV